MHRLTTQYDAPYLVAKLDFADAETLPASRVMFTGEVTCGAGDDVQDVRSAVVTTGPGRAT